MIEQTLVILKPDALLRWITGKVIDRLEAKGLKLVASKMILLTDELLRQHYSHLVDKPFFWNLVDYMTSAPVIVQVWEWKEATSVVRLMAGVTNPRQAQPGTIRWDFAIDIPKNVIHASENWEIAQQEISRFFKQEEIFSYKRIDEDMLYE